MAALPRWKTIADEFIAQIEDGSLKPGTVLPGEVAIASQHRVSRQTAHRAIHELQRLGYVRRQRRWGTTVADRTERRTGLIGLLFDYTTDWPQADLLRGINDGLDGHGRLVLCDVRNDPQREAEMIQQLAREVDGLISYPICHPGNEEHFQRFLAQGKPIVLVDRLLEGIHTDAVTTRNYGSTRQALETVVANGATRIAYLGGDNVHVSSVRDRKRAFLDVAGEAGEHRIREFPKSIEGHPAYLQQAVCDAISALHHRSGGIDAIFCVQDCYTEAALVACDELGLSVPDEVQILGYNDWPATMFHRPERLHQIHQESREMGRLAAERLSARLAGDDSDPQLIEVPARIVTTTSSHAIVDDRPSPMPKEAPSQ